jgi:hypothetical protein
MEVDEPLAAVEEVAMDIEEDRAPHLTELNEESLLAQASLQVLRLSCLGSFPVPIVLACKECAHGVTPKQALKHVAKHGVRLSKEEKKALTVWLTDTQLPSMPSDIPIPRRGSAPIEGLQVRQGYACSNCLYAAPELSSIKRHLSMCHPNTLGTFRDHSVTSAVQAYFPSQGIYFAVNTVLAGLDINDPYAIYINQIASVIDSSKKVNPPTSVNEIPPLLKMTLWHVHLADHLTDKDKILAVTSLVSLPTTNRGLKWLGQPLGNIILNYMKDIRKKADNAPLGIKCLLMDCPRQVSH